MLLSCIKIYIYIYIHAYDNNDNNNDYYYIAYYYIIIITIILLSTVLTITLLYYIIELLIGTRIDVILYDSWPCGGSMHIAYLCIYVYVFNYIYYVL